jgi:hypothetical protein
MQTLIILIVILAIYLVPTIIAFSREHSNATGVMLVNIFLGWSLIGWFGALIWSVQVAKSEKIKQIEIKIKK